MSRPGAPALLGRRRAREDERGAGLGLLAVGLLLISFLIAGLFFMIAAQITAHRVQGAADLAALAGAQAKNRGTSDACAGAGRQATASDMGVVECSVAGDDLSFVVTVRLRGAAGPVALGVPLTFEASAHAGVDRRARVS